MKRLLWVALFAWAVPATAKPAKTVKKPVPSPAKPKGQSQPQQSPVQKRLALQRYVRFAYKWSEGLSLPMSDLPLRPSLRDDSSEENREKWESFFNMYILLCKGVQAERSNLFVPADFAESDQLFFSALYAFQSSCEKALDGEPSAGDDFSLAAKHMADAMHQLAALTRQLFPEGPQYQDRLPG